VVRVSRCRNDIALHNVVFQISILPGCASVVVFGSVSSGLLLLLCNGYPIHTMALLAMLPLLQLVCLSLTFDSTGLISYNCISSTEVSTCISYFNHTDTLNQRLHTNIMP
jgi:hypothetical protein